MTINHRHYQSEEENIHSLLSKVKMFNHQIGHYVLHLYTDSYHCFVFLTNGTIFFTPHELDANQCENLDLEMMVKITRRFESRPLKKSEDREM